MKSKVNKFIKYPLYFSPPTWLEKLMTILHFGVIKCYVCGSYTLIYIKGENLRETCICVKCRSTNRQRQIACIACEVIASEKGSHISSLKDFVMLDNFVIYNTEASGALHEQLSRMKTYICSEYMGNSYKSGNTINNVMHQDLMNLSLSNESINMVLSSDVFEHIPDPYKAHWEVYRILKRGGRHIFTVPFYQTEFLDENRAAISSDQKTFFIKEPVYHEDPIRKEGALVYKIFSLEMLIKLREIGFRTNLYLLHKPWYGILGPNAVVFEAIKE